MLARFAVQARMAKVRALSGSAAILGGAPPGYQNIYLPDKEMPQPLPRGGMTPALRAQLAKKYNMRPEDYKPCAWSDDYTTQSYGDYPLLEYENAANRNAHYNWDNHHMRRNYGDPLHHDSMFLIGSYPNAKNPKYEQVYDYYLGINFYFAFLGFIATLIFVDFYAAKEWGYAMVGANRVRDGFCEPFQQYNGGLYRWEGAHQEGVHAIDFRFSGMVQNMEDNRFERWGVREQVNYCIPGWGDLEKVPEYAHTY